MKTHPVPQNIMDVEFKLFGELTVRQFGYVAGGASIAFICYIIFDGLDIVRWPLVIFFALLGLMLALFKVNDRPFEVWLANFVYSMFTSQRKVWKKSNKIPNILSSNEIKRESQGVTSSINKAPLSSVYTSPSEVAKSNVDIEEQNSLKALDSLFEGNSNTIVNTTNVLPTKLKEDLKVETPKGFEEYKPPKGENPFMEDFNADKVNESKPVIPEQNVNPPVEVVKPIEPVQTSTQNNVPASSSLDLDDILPETKSREDLMKSYDEKAPVIKEKDMNIDSNLPTENTNINVNNNTNTEPNEEYIKKLKEQLNEQNSLINNLREKEDTKPISEVVNEEQVSVPNLVSGVTLDKDKNAIANVTVIIKDSKFKPVRAMRSTNLGRFVTTTPLPSGEYSLEASKGDMKFESVDFILDGSGPKVMEIFAI